MRRFLYYFPGRPGMNPGLLARYGLLDRFERGRPGSGDLLEHVITAVDLGPDAADGEPSRGGCIVAAGSRQAEYAPSRQTWCKAWAGKVDKPTDMPAGWFYVGVEQPWPTPEDLVREMVITGPACVLADEKPWRLPVLHRWSAEDLSHVPNLPTALRPKPDGSGKLEKVVRPEYAGVDAIAGAIWSDFVASRPTPAEGSFQRAVAVLATNYRIGPEECGLLGVMNEDDVQRVLATAIDLPAVEHQAAMAGCDGVECVEPVIRPDKE